MIFIFSAVLYHSLAYLFYRILANENLTTIYQRHLDMVFYETNLILQEYTKTIRIHIVVRIKMNKQGDTTIFYLLLFCKLHKMLNSLISTGNISLTTCYMRSSIKKKCPSLFKTKKYTKKSCRRKNKWKCIHCISSLAK